MSKVDRFRYSVTVNARPYGRPYQRVVVVDGPQPDRAASKALSDIVADEECDLWQSDKVVITVERVR